jgi:ribonuclease BN (tRNA processing enzyme)
MVETDETIMLIDAGTGLVCNEYRLVDRKKIHMAFTHFHMDHILAFPFFPYHLKRDQTLTVHHDEKISSPPERALLDFVRRPFFPMDHKSLTSNVAWSSFIGRLELGDLTVTTFPLNHPEFSVGYRFEKDGKVYVHVSDHEHEPAFDAVILENIADADLLTMDAMYDPRDYRKGFGHTRWTDVVRLAGAARVKKLLLSHHHYHYTDRRIDGIVKDARSLYANTDAAHEGGIYIL